MKSAYGYKVARRRNPNATTAATYSKHQEAKLKKPEGGKKRGKRQQQRQFTAPKGSPNQNHPPTLQD